MDTVISRDGTSIAFERTGRGVPIVFVAGALNDRATLAPLAAQLAADFTTIVYDRRGRGDSGDTAPYAIDREIDDLDALIASVGGQAVVFGFSSGGILAALAAARGSVISHLILCEPAFPVDSGDMHWSPDDIPDRIADLIAEERRGDAVALFQQGVGLPPEVIAGMRHAPFWPALERLAPTLVYDTTLSRRGTLTTATLATITNPTEVLYGEATFPILREAARSLAEGLPGAKLRALPGMGNHFIVPEVTATAVRQFLAQPSADRSDHV